MASPTLNSAVKAGAQSRKQVVDRIRECMHSYWIPKLYSVYHEVGCCRKGRLRFDMLALNMKRHTVGLEIKSCYADFSSDRKWHQYLEYRDQFYFCITTELWATHENQIREAVANTGAGVLVCGTTHALVRVRAKKLKRVYENRYWLITKLVWLGGCSRAKRKEYVTT